MFGREGPMGGMSAQRRPGLQPGDTAGGDNEKRIATQHAQRRPGLQPGDTPPDVPLRDRQRGRSTKAGTPTRRHPAIGLAAAVVHAAQRRPGLQPGDTVYEHGGVMVFDDAQRRPGLQPGDTRQNLLGLGVDHQAAQRRPGLQPGDTPPRGCARTRWPPRSLNEGRDSNPATPARIFLASVSTIRPLNEGRDSNPATPPPVISHCIASCAAQRRPGLQPGDTRGWPLCAFAVALAQRRPGLQPGDTHLVPDIFGREPNDAQRRPGLQPGDTSPSSS